MRQILHPGLPVVERTRAVAGSPVPLHFRLEPGRPVDEAVAQGFSAAGCMGGFVAFQGGRCRPFRYVMPAASSDPRYAAWYSATFEPKGPVDIRRACAIVGERDGKPFLHCHGIWDTADGPRMGHLLAPETLVAEPIEVSGIGFRDATFKATPDPETNFTLFEPVGERPGKTAGAPALLAKVRPNEDISLAIEEICTNHGIRAARIHGIGSLNGVRFTDGTEVGSHATEVLIRSGHVESDSAAGHPRAQILIDVVDMNGAIFSGEIVRGDNPVCVTFELVIEAVDA